MKKTELILGIFGLAGIILSLWNIPFSGVLTILSLMFLSMFYYLLSFALLNDIRLGGIFRKESYSEISTLNIVLAVLVGFVLSNLTIGIMFKTRSYPGADLMITIGLILAALIALSSIILYMKIRSGFPKKVLFRSLILGCAALLVYFFFP
jgi:uncharacterized membrane protein